MQQVTMRIKLVIITHPHAEDSPRKHCCCSKALLQDLAKQLKESHLVHW